MELQKRSAYIEGCNAWGITSQIWTRKQQLYRRNAECRLAIDKEESYAVFITEDWQVPFIGYLAQGILPTDRKLAHKLKKLASRYFLQNDILFKNGYHGDPLRCLDQRKPEK